MLRAPTTLPYTMPPAEAYLLGWSECEAEQLRRADTGMVADSSWQRRIDALLAKLEAIAPWELPPPPAEEPWPGHDTAGQPLPPPGPYDQADAA